MISFASDYAEGAHPLILERIARHNFDKMPGYGTDLFCESARKKIRDACSCDHAEIFFLVGGTQANQMVIDSLLPPYAGVITAQTGHIALHEAGAIEARGHKVIPLRGHDGKLYAEDVQTWIDNFFADQNHEHMVYPGMISISHPTEYGTLYRREELFALRDVACAHNIPLFLDGARLGYALGCPSNELTLPDIAFLTDVFSIGGTKVGALFGEAIVFSKENVPPHFSTCMKRQGALLAKGWLLGLQFDTLFTDTLYEDLGRNANVQAKKIRDALEEKGYHFFLDSPTNQIFLLFENHELDEFMKKINVSFWERIDSDHILIRLATSWATTDSQVQELLDIL